MFMCCLIDKCGHYYRGWSETRRDDCMSFLCGNVLCEFVIIDHMLRVLFTATFVFTGRAGKLPW